MCGCCEEGGWRGSVGGLRGLLVAKGSKGASHVLRCMTYQLVEGPVCFVRLMEEFTPSLNRY